MYLLHEKGRCGGAERGAGGGGRVLIWGVLAALSRLVLADSTYLLSFRRQSHLVEKTPDSLVSTILVRCTYRNRISPSVQYG